MSAFRSVVADPSVSREKFLYELKVGLPAASGRPPARQRLDGHRGAGLTFRIGGARTVTTAPAGAHLGHAPGDSNGQSRLSADSSTWRLTCANAVDLHPVRDHTVYGMQGVRGSNPLSSTRHDASAVLPLRARRQQIVSRACHVTANTLSV